MEQLDFLFTPMPALIFLVPLVLIAAVLVTVLLKSKKEDKEASAIVAAGVALSQTVATETVKTVPIPEPVAPMSSPAFVTPVAPMAPVAPTAPIVNIPVTSVMSPEVAVSATSVTPESVVPAIEEVPAYVPPVASWKPSEPSLVVEDNFMATPTQSVSSVVEPMPIVAEMIPPETVSSEVIDHAPLVSESTQA